MPPFIALLRPHQWLKNFFVLSGLLFAHAWGNTILLQKAIAITIAFCLCASTVYIINDIFDRTHDQLHPHKKHRPLAAATITVSSAWLYALGLGLIGVCSGFLISPLCGLILLTYLSLNLLYSWQLKQWPLFDVLVIACGFLLRVFAGTSGIGIPPSAWILICTLMLTLFLAFCKRRAEHRYQASPHYSEQLLNSAIILTAGGAIVSYVLYVYSQNSTMLHPYPKLIYTIPLVIYGLSRYLYLLRQSQQSHFGLDMARDIFYDYQLITLVMIWLGIILWQ